MSRNIGRRQFITHLSIAAGFAAGSISTLGATTESEPNWRIGCYTRPWGDHDYRTALDAIAGAGFKYAGLMTCKSESRLVLSVQTKPDEAHTIGEEVKKRGLKVPSVYGGGISVDKSLQEGIDGLRNLIDCCVAAGSRTLLMGGVGEKELFDPYYKAIAECCDYAAEKKLAITVKPHGGLNATGPQCRKTVELVNHKNFTLWYDPGNIYFYSDGQLDPVDDAATVDGIVTGMCVKDFQLPKEVELTPGTGLVKFPAVMARLKKGGFTGGDLVIETLQKGDLKATLSEAVKARKFVESLVA